MMASAAWRCLDRSPVPASIITRSSDAQLVRVIPADRLAQFLAQEATVSGVLVADLALGAWRSHHAARELFDQSSLAWPELASFNDGGDRGRVWDGLSYANVIGQGIDSEARGNETVRRALDLATALADYLSTRAPTVVIIVAPHYGIDFSADNKWFLYFLAQGLRNGPHRLVLAAGEELPGNLPMGWQLERASVAYAAVRPRMASEQPASLLALVPGTLPSELLSDLDPDGIAQGVIPLDSGRFLVAPDERRSPTDISPFTFDELGARVETIPWLRCYAQVYGNNYFVNPALLCSQAWHCFAEGGHETALRLLARAASCCRSQRNRHGIDAQLQGMRISLHRFADAAAAKPAVGGGPMKNFLLTTKGWGLVMSGDAATGREYLEQAEAQLPVTARGQIEHLYLQNILALAAARTGATAEALRLEQEIAAANDRLEHFDWRLHYVNQVNTARLLRQTGHFAQAKRAYLEAFATASGDLSESDRIYDEACLARLAAETGQPVEAMQRWFRSALSFAASVVPEAISARCIRMLLAGQAVTAEDAIESVAEFLHTALRAAQARLPPKSPWRRAEAADTDDSAVPVFLCENACQPRDLSSASCAVGADGWSVIAVRVDAKPAYDGPHHRRLRRLLAHLIRWANPDHEDMAANGYVVDGRHGRPMAIDERAQIESCLRFGIRRSLFAGQAIELAPACLVRLKQVYRLRLGDLVRDVECVGGRARIAYKRYRPERWEDDTYGLIVAAARGGWTLGSLIDAGKHDARGAVCARARALEKERVLYLELPDDWRRLVDRSEC
jgi:hypothetical protein